MSDEGNNNFMRHVYMGEEGEIIPEGATHVIVHESVTVIRERAFEGNRGIVEVICHEGVENIEEAAFSVCPSLERVIMPGVTIVECCAFCGCEALRDVECDKLEIIREGAFCGCESLKCINLPSAKIVEASAFEDCTALLDVKFGSKLERIEKCAFLECTSLGRITIPFKDGIITHDNIFTGCKNLKYVDLVEGELYETVAALHLEDWRNRMNEEIHAINQILPDADAGDRLRNDMGRKAIVIRGRIRAVLGKIIEYKAEHRRVIDEAATTLQRFLSQEIVIHSVLPFLELPSYSFEVRLDRLVEKDIPEIFSNGEQLPLENELAAAVTKDKTAKARMFGRIFIISFPILFLLVVVISLVYFISFGMPDELKNTFRSYACDSTPINPYPAPAASMGNSMLAMISSLVESSPRLSLELLPMAAMVGAAIHLIPHLLVHFVEYILSGEIVV